MKRKYLRISRKRTLANYLNMLERYSLYQGFPSTEVNGLRWRRLQCCIDSIKTHLINVLDGEELREV